MVRLCCGHGVGTWNHSTGLGVLELDEAGGGGVWGCDVMARAWRM